LAAHKHRSADHGAQPPASVEHARWLLTSYLLPRDIPIFADVSMGVKAHNDKVWWLSGK